jgi:hypothetical protein
LENGKKGPAGVYVGEPPNPLNRTGPVRFEWSAIASPPKK